VHYFSDFDPPGWQMPISVAQKLRAFKCRDYPNLGIELYPVVLTLEQVRQFNLLSTPLKPEEQRADNSISSDS
jgi:hypothetical protein